IFLTSLVLPLIGCSSLEPYDGVKRAPKASVDIFEAGTTPSRRYKVIQEFSAEGNRGEESKKHRDFVKQAKKLGADAVIFKPTQTTSFTFHMGMMGGPAEASYRAVAVVYQ